MLHHSYHQGRIADAKCYVSAGFGVVRRWSGDTHRQCQEQLSHGMTLAQCEKASDTRRELILANPHAVQSEIARILRDQYLSHKIKVQEVEYSKEALESDENALTGLPMHEHIVQHAYAASYRVEYSKIDLSGIRDLHKTICDDDHEFRNKKKLVLEAEISALQDKIQMRRLRQDPTMMEPEFNSPWNTELSEKLLRLKADTAAHDASVSAMKDWIQAIRIESGASACYERYQKKRLELKKNVAAARSLQPKLSEYMKTYEEQVCVLQRHGEGLLRDIAL